MVVLVAVASASATGAIVLTVAAVGAVPVAVAVRFDAAFIRDCFCECNNDDAYVGYDDDDDDAIVLPVFSSFDIAVASWIP